MSGSFGEMERGLQTGSRLQQPATVGKLRPAFERAAGKHCLQKQTKSRQGKGEKGRKLESIDDIVNNLLLGNSKGSNGKMRGGRNHVSICVTCH